MTRTTTQRCYINIWRNFHGIVKTVRTDGTRSPLMGLLQLRYEHDSSTIRVRFEHDSATTRYNTLQGFRALASYSNRMLYRARIVLESYSNRARIAIVIGPLRDWEGLSSYWPLRQFWYIAKYYYYCESWIPTTQNVLTNRHSTHNLRSVLRRKSDDP